LTNLSAILVWHIRLECLLESPRKRVWAVLVKRHELLQPHGEVTRFILVKKRELKLRFAADPLVVLPDL
jgi:hypothetical protein